jgi:pimeloyl-ACP methyl ester carboxylesterase
MVTMQPEGPPPFHLTVGELTGPLRGLLTWPRMARVLSRLPRGAGEPVVVLPGYRTSDSATLLLRQALWMLGYRAHGWGLGINHGDIGELVPEVVERFARIVEAERQPVRAIGWSAGGLLARQATKEAPYLVDRIITMGTPVRGGPKFTVVGRRLQAQGHDVESYARIANAWNEVPVPVPVTAIYSRRDGVVHWAACVDERAEGVEHVEVDATHTELPLSAQVLAVIAERLAADVSDRAEAA